ncbi:MAG TPA: hypothetical protein VFT66_16310 [Roseiflexaceae bacterium]|jgi:hypothetical protein|nr:hypothetical protein [Roseiflexaceae bacterium]
MHTSRRLFFLLALFWVAGVLPVQARPAAQPQGPYPVYLPLAAAPAPTNNPFGFDMHTASSDAAMQLAAAAKPRWSRAGTIFWSDVEPTRGAYNWAALAGVEMNVRRLRAAGIEPTLVVQRTPAWAQSVAGRLCSPPKVEAFPDFAAFMHTVAEHFSQSDLTVNYWEIGNETDIAVTETSDDYGIGCWLDPARPYNGGSYYGEALKQVVPAIKSANPQAQVVAGALIWNWPDDSRSRTFLEGMLASGAAQSVDALSYHAYGEWGAGDLLVNKALRIRELLAQYGMPDKPLIATEVAAICTTDDVSGCPPDYNTWIQRQANYAARIYAEAIALNLKGAFWYTLTSTNPGFRYSHLIDDENGTLIARPSYHAFVNSANLLEGAVYAGPPLQAVPPTQLDTVQALKFRKMRSSFDSRPSTLYVIWVPRVGSPGVSYPVHVAPGAAAICSTKLGGAPDDPDPGKRMRTFYCSDTNKDGVIWFSAIDFPQYIEVLE